jgi:D-glycero-alpha-D-manno-heptose 1-phosphate guanylyltransferase
MEAIVLAGGLGTRLRSKIGGIPKPMAPVAGRPFLEIVLDRLIGAGFHHAILSVGYLGEVIRDYFGAEYGAMPITYVSEESPLGTGGAIRNALPAAREESVFILNGDTYFECDYSAMHALHHSTGATLTIAVTFVDQVARYGGVSHEGGSVTGFIEKGREGSGWINAGTYLLDRRFEWPAHLGEKFSFETDLLVPLLPRLQHAVFLSQSRFLDIGVPEDLERAQLELGNKSRADGPIKV